MTAFSNGDEENSQIKSIAEDIEAYLADKHDAADTLEGILNWWVLRQRLRESEQNVAKAIQLLKKKGKLDSRIMADGTEVFCARRAE